MTEGKLYSVFISGYQYTNLTSWKNNNPVVMIVNHADKLLYIVLVPLDVASIGDAILCAPLVIKRAGDSLICSILANCTGSSLKSVITENNAIENGLTKFEGVVDSKSISKVETAGAEGASTDDVCKIHDIPLSTLRAIYTEIRGHVRIDNDHVHESRYI